MIAPQNLEKEDIDILIDGYESKVRKWEQQISELNTEIRRYKDKIASLRGAPSSLNAPKQVYDSDWTWNNKIKYILETKGRPLTSNEIVEYVLEFEPKLLKKSVVSSISATLSAATDKKYRKIEQPAGKDSKYELI